MKTKVKIGRVWIEHKMDDSPDTSWIGEYTDEGGDYAIVNVGEHAGEYYQDVPVDELPRRGGKYRYFQPAMSGDETGNPESPKQDWERMNALNRGDWHFIGIIAKAEIAVPVPNNPGNVLIQTIRSGGLWGIESDSEKEHLKEVARDELHSLKEQLRALGIGERAINHAFKEVDEENKQTTENHETKV